MVPHTSAISNPALHQESLSQQARVIPPRERESLLHWLESTGRFESREVEPGTEEKVAEELDDIIETSYNFDKDDDSDDDSWEED
ncbi:DUF3134 family protein [Egbenema bharatensis]|uniref:DUF3134 family protein n=1 Tax=Egbenema bharatensis TaxID=3463334 RepID=UPI003A838694